MGRPRGSYFTSALLVRGRLSPTLLDTLARERSRTFPMKTKQAPTLSAELLTQREVAKLLGICPETVCRWTRRGLIPCVRVGRRFLRYERKALAALISSRRDGKGDAK